MTQTPGFCGGDPAPHCNPRKHQYQCLPCWCQSLTPQSLVTQIDPIFSRDDSIAGNVFTAGCSVDLAPELPALPEKPTPHIPYSMQ